MCTRTQRRDGGTEEPVWPCRRCGNCCRVAGYVRLTEADVAALAAHLGLTPEAFVNQYTRLTADRRGLSLVERNDQSCIFLDEQGACIVNQAKPAQCRDFPTGWKFTGYETICEAARSARAE